jgi:hypothetical protein
MMQIYCGGGLPWLVYLCRLPQVPDGVSSHRRCGLRIYVTRREISSNMLNTFRCRMVLHWMTVGFHLVCVHGREQFAD